nr:unnamed protein product [Callosobruchus chinensis]
MNSAYFEFQEDFTIVSYCPKKSKGVILLSTMDDTGDVDPETKKPRMILHYNMTKCGADVVDQKCAAHST